MNETNQIKIEVNPTNPVEYLACLGIFEIAARFDETTLAHWTIDGNETTFVIESAKLDDKTLLDIIVPTLTEAKKWSVFTNDEKEVIRLEAKFSNSENRIEVYSLDWWYESLKEDGEINKSGWKMYAGNQTVEKTILEGKRKSKEISPDLITACQEKAGLVSAKIESLFEISAKMTGRFGFDPRSSRNALDVGYSSNDLKIPIATYSFSELMALFGLQSFFPTRTKQSNQIVSSRGWMRENRKYFFDYSLWLMPVPIGLARSFANNPQNISENKIKNFRSPRASRDKYSNLTLALPINK